VPRHHSPNAELKNTPAGHIERAVAAVRHQGAGKIALVVACAVALLMIALR